MTAPIKMTRTLWPLPGGTGNYLNALLWILTAVEATSETEAVVSRMMERFQLSSRKATKSYLRVVDALGFIEIVGNSVYLTPQGNAYLSHPSSDTVRVALLQNIEGCVTLAEILVQRPSRIGRLLAEMRAAGHTWTTDSQVRYRLRWLEEVGAVERLGGVRPEYRLVDVDRTGTESQS